jgi:ABC-2 type transport system permease protein
MSPRVGSPLWLLRHELRLAARGLGGIRLRFALTVGLFFWALVHLAAWGFLKGMGPAALPPSAIQLIGGITWLFITFLLSHAIILSVDALFDRGDFDLLLSSPLRTQTVFIVRGLGIAFGCTFPYLLFLSPLANVGPFMGHPELLAIYPALVSIGLLAATLGMLLTLVLVGLVGARRARTSAQVFGALVGATLFLLSQAPNLLGRESLGRIAVAIKHMAEPGGILEPGSLIWFPSNAALGDPLALAALMLAGIGGFWLVVNTTHRRFLSGTQESVIGSVARASRVPRAGSGKFRRGLWRIVLAKEWKLILRDPNLIAQTLLQMIYLLPLLLVAFRAKDVSVPVVGGSIAIAGMLAGSLAWITVAAEDAPELIGAAPVDLARIRWLKVLAALVPVWILVLPLAIYLMIRNPLVAGVFVVCIVGCTVSLGVSQVWYPRLGNRKDMKKRGRSTPLINMLEIFTALGWAATAYCLMAAPLFTPLALGFAILAPAATWILGKARRDEGALV